MCKHVYMWFTCVNWWFTCGLKHVNCQFTHRQRLSLHSRSLESYKVDYTCKCGWIDIVSAIASAIEVYTCKPVVYTCKPVVYTQSKDCPYISDRWNCTRRITLVKCGWIDIASAIEVYTCKPAVYTCKPVVYTQAKTVLTFQIIGIIQGRLHR